MIGMWASRNTKAVKELLGETYSWQSHWIGRLPTPDWIEDESEDTFKVIVEISSMPKPIACSNLHCQLFKHRWRLVYLSVSTVTERWIFYSLLSLGQHLLRSNAGLETVVYLNNLTLGNSDEELCIALQNIEWSL